MLIASYMFAALSMCGAALFLVLRLRFFITASSMLLGSLLLIYGPAFLAFTLSGGERTMLLKRLRGDPVSVEPFFNTLVGKSPALVLSAMNISVALMFAGVVAGILLVDRLASVRTAAIKAALVTWNSRRLETEGSPSVLLALLVVALVFATWISWSEHHIDIIRGFINETDPGAKIAYRLQHGGSPNYFYRLLIGAIAPMLIIWAILKGVVDRSWSLVVVALLLAAVVMAGKVQTLSKAPPAFFIIELLVAGILLAINRLTIRSGLAVSAIVILVLYGVTVLLKNNDQAFDFLYLRLFELPSESLLETFAAFPAHHPFMWGANIRPLAALMGVDYVPAYSIVAQLWHGTKDLTSNALFIADAWADFSYAGVAVYSVLAGATCRIIDVYFLAKGKTDVAIAVMAATFFGIFTLMVSALNTAALSGGLISAPVLAYAILQIGRFKRLNSI